MQLNDQQERAVRSSHRRIGVVAGPGTGKTAVLTERVHRLIRAGVDPRKILVCTFTEKAAKELVERLLGTGSRLPSVGTLHAFCAKVVRVMGDSINFSGLFTIYDDVDRVAVLEDAASDLGVRPAKAATLLKNERVRRLFEDRMRAANALTYDQLETYALQGLSLRVAEPFQFDHILVDECQDLNPRQSRILKVLAPKSLFMVGDPRQSIYAFRGASPALFQSYIAHDDVERIDLTVNYRSGPEIVDLANGVMQSWPALSPGSDAGGSVSLVSAEEEGDLLVGAVVGHLSSGLAPGDIAVLGRTWSCMRWAAAKLREAGVPFRFYGSSSDPWETPTGRTIARWLLMQGGPHDDNFAALVARSLRPDLNMGPLRSAAGQARVSLWSHLTDQGVLPERSTEDSALAYAHQLYPEREMPERLAESLASPRRGSMKAFRYWWFYGRQTSDRVTSDTGKVHLMTIHGAKGLEFPAVVMPWVNRGVYPYFSSEDGEEDRRVFYVGMTRAKNALTFTRQTMARGRPTSCSPFLRPLFP